MLEYITLKKNGELEYRSGPQNFIVDNDIILPCLNMLTVIEKGASLRSLFKMFSLYPVLTALDPWIPHYMRDIKALPEIGCRKRFDALVIQRHIEAANKTETPKAVLEKIDKQGARHMRIEYVKGDYSSLNHYIGLTGKIKGEEERYSISMTPLIEIFDVPLESCGCEIYMFGDKEYQHLVFEETFTLNEIITAIMKAIGFFGTDEQKKKEVESLKKVIEKIDRKKKKEERFTVIDGGKGK